MLCNYLNVWLHVNSHNSLSCVYVSSDCFGFRCFDDLVLWSWLHCLDLRLCEPWVILFDDLVMRFLIMIFRLCAPTWGHVWDPGFSRGWCVWNGLQCRMAYNAMQNGLQCIPWACIPRPSLWDVALCANTSLSVSDVVGGSADKFVIWCVAPAAECYRNKSVL